MAETCKIPWCVMAETCKIHNKSQKKSKNGKPNFAVLYVTRITTFSKHVYTFELQFFLEK
jgi:hypothetical protein